MVGTTRGRGLILTENKLSEHHFYACSGRKRSAENPDRKACLNWPALKADLPAACWQTRWAAAAGPRTYWKHIELSEEGEATLESCPAASDGYQLFRQQALAEGIARSGRYDLVVSAVAYDARNAALVRSLRSTGVDDFTTGWGPLFAGRARFSAWAHQDGVDWVRSHDAGTQWGEWLSYVEDRYGYGKAGSAPDVG